MKAEESITWEKIFQSWSLRANSGPEIIRKPKTLQEIHVPYERSGEYIFGYDWLSYREFEQRKASIEKGPTDFLYFTKPTNKGTIYTLQMLQESENDEERAAVWIYAFSQELLNLNYRGNIVRTALQLSNLVFPFLSERFFMWHHAMRRLIPAIYFGYPLFEGTDFSIEAVIQLACVNAALISHEYVPILYSSLAFGERPENFSIRKSKK